MTNKIVGRFDAVIGILKKQKHITAYKLTKENWFPSYDAPDDQAYLLKVSLMALSDGLFRVCVWGADDYGMEKDQESLKKAIVLYINLMLLPYIKRNDLVEMGFVTA